MPNSLPAKSLSILWIKAGPLFPLNTGGRKRSHAMLEQIQREHCVTFLALVPENVEPGKDDLEGSYAAKKIFVPWHDSKPSRVGFAIEATKNLLFSTLPLALDRFRSEALNLTIAEQSAGGRYDLVVCDFLFPAPAFDDLEFEVPVVMFQHNVESDIWRRLAESKRNPLARLYFADQHRRMEQSEKQLSLRFDGVITVSPQDSDSFRQRFGLENVLGDVPTGVDCEALKPDPTIEVATPPRIAFLGSMDWMPNIDAVRWFAEDILPLIRKQIPDVEFHIIGRSPTASVRRLATDDSSVVVTGTVPEVQPLMQACELMVVPLLAGGGTRIKILEAMAMGVPVVSTSIGAEGLPMTHDRDILLANSAEDLADAVISLLNDRQRAQQIADAARAKVIAEHSWENVVEHFINLCATLISLPKQST